MLLLFWSCVLASRASRVRHFRRTAKTDGACNDPYVNQGYRTPGKDTSRLTLNAAGRPMTSLEASRLGGHTRRMHNGGAFALERCGSRGDILMWLYTTIVMFIDLQTAFF